MTPEEGIRALVPYVYHPATPRGRVEEDLQIRLQQYPSQKGYLGQLQAVLGYETYARLDAIRVPPSSSTERTTCWCRRRTAEISPHESTAPAF
jgi:hypothetical protein